MARRQREEAMGVVFRDLLLLLALLMLTLVVLIIPLIRIPKESRQVEKAAGDMLAEIVWNPESRADIDIWVQAPNGEKVGYLLPDGTVFSLVRDDMGREKDFSGLNYEFLSREASRMGATASRWCITQTTGRETCRRRCESPSATRRRG